MDSWHDCDDDDDNGDDSELRDIRFGGKEALIFVIDSSPTMHVKVENADGGDEDQMTPFQMALGCVRATLQNKIFSSPSDVIGLLLFGTEQKVDVRDFDNLALVLPMSIAEGKSILKLEDLMAHPEKCDELYGSSCKFAVHEALWQCQSLFNEVRGKTSVRNVILMTCNDDPHADDPGLKRHALKKGADLQDTGISLEVIPLVGGGEGEEEAFDWRQFYRDMLPSASDSAQSDQSTRRYNDLLKVVRKKLHKKRSSGKIKFDLGHGVEMAVSTFNLVRKAWKPPKTRLARDTNEPVRSQRNFIHPRTGALLMPTDIELQQTYGGCQIRFTADEAKSIMKMNTEPGMKLYGFKSISDLKFSQYVRSGNFIYPEESAIKGSRNLFSALLKRCLERNVMAICMLKPRDRSSPSFVALLPMAEVKDPDDGGVQIVPPGFSIFYLPFADDIRDVPEARFVKPEAKQLETARQIVGKLKLKSFSVEAFDNPSLQAHFRLVEALALDRSDAEHEPDTMLPPFDRMKKKLKDLPEVFRQRCGYVEGGGGAKRKASGAAAASGDEEPKRKAARGGAINMSGYVTAKSVHKLTVDQLKAYLSSQEKLLVAKGSSSWWTPSTSGSS